MNEVVKFNLIENMEKYGGSFIRALAECIRRADETNLNKIVNAFPEYIDKYIKFDTK